MLTIGLPLVFALAIWWFCTGAILFLVRLPGRGARWSVAGASIALAAALGGLVATRDGREVLDAYLAFTCAIVAWGWVETTFLTGTLTGPRRAPCPPDATGARRMALAAGTVLHHDLAIAILCLVIVGLAGQGANGVGAATFLILATMRLSAQLNLFLGVKNRAEDFFPERLRYLASYFADRRINPLFPVSVLVAGAVAAGLGAAALDPAATPAGVVGSTLLATLLALAILEHGFMVLPVPLTALFGWGLRTRRAAEPAAT